MHRVPLIRKARHWMLRRNFAAFIGGCFRTVDPVTRYLPNWHIDAVAEYLEATRRSEITRLIINMPPRSLKSVSVSVAWPAWLLGHDPSVRIMAASYASGLSVKHSLDTRLVLQSPWYRALFPNTQMALGENEKHKFVTTQRGFRFATSVGGTATGEGGDILIADDLMNPLQAASKTEREQACRWFDQTFTTRLNDKAKGRIVVVMQRLHPEDLTAHLLARGGWEQLCLPAIAEVPTVISMGRFRRRRGAGDVLHPGREGAELLERARRELGSIAFAAQYQQQPIPEAGGMIECAWLARYGDVPEAFDRIVQSWDTAIKAGASHDASACITFGQADGVHYVLDATVLRAEYPELKRQVLRLAERWQPDLILMEDKASGQSLLQDLRRESALPLLARLPRGDKITRVAAISAMIEAGKLLLPRYAAWLEALEAEILAFPNVAHDDQVDALTQYLLWVREKQGALMRLRRL